MDFRSLFFRFMADVRGTNVPYSPGGIADNLLNVALGGNQLRGSGDPALVNANLLPNGITPTGTGSATGVLAPVTSAVETVGAGVTSAVQGVTGGALSPLGVSAGTPATAGPPDIGRASCRARVCQCVYLSVVA